MSVIVVVGLRTTNEDMTKKYLSELYAVDVGKRAVTSVFVAGESPKKALSKEPFIDWRMWGTGFFVPVSEKVGLEEHLIFNKKEPEIPWLFFEYSYSVNIARPFSELEGREQC